MSLGKDKKKKDYFQIYFLKNGKSVTGLWILT